METSRSNSKIRIHDGIVGVLYLVSVILAFTVDLQWLYMAGGIAILQISSYFTGFCPVYFVLDRMMREGRTKPDAAGPKPAL